MEAGNRTRMSEVTAPASKYPPDRQGRPLPDGSWPPGKEAPGRLEQLRRFVNTTNRENGAERFDDPVGLDEWLAEEGRAPLRTDAAGLTTILTLRTVLGDLAVANHDATPDADAWRRLEDLAAGAPMVMVVSERGPTWEPVGAGVAGLVGEMVAIVAEAWLAGTWLRLKACSNSHCRWVYWDHSRSGTGVWCSMSACGQRDKMRRYRRRRADPDRG